MKKLIALLVSSIAIAFALPATGATVQKVQSQPDKAIAAAPAAATRFILVAKTDKAKPDAKTKANKKTKAAKKASKKEAKVKKTGTGFKLKPTAPMMA
jgi:parvulin-like peptidyl-prolyl isomerase